MKRSLGLVVILCILLSAFAVAANESPMQEINWNISDGTLTLSGTGAMENYKNPSDAPWYTRKDEITKIVVENGITHIGNYAFYDLENVKEAVIPEDVESVGMHAFSYTEGSKATVSELTSEYQFKFESDATAVSAGDEFTVTVTLSADFKNLAGAQTSVIYDKEKIAIDENWYDPEWYATVGDDNLGYISDPDAGFVANNLRIMYVSMSGARIDEESPLYNVGKTDVVMAKVKCKALCDIENLNISNIMIKNSAVSIIDPETNAVAGPKCGETQLVAVTSLPMKELTIDTKSDAVIKYAKANSIAIKENTVPDNSNSEEKNDSEEETVTSPDKISVVLDGKTLEFDVEPYINEDNKTMLPLRGVFEAMGAAVLWDQETFTVFSTLDEDFIALQIGKTTMFRNSESLEMDAPSVLKDSRTMISLNAVKEAFGHMVEWDATSKTVTITSK